MAVGSGELPEILPIAGFRLGATSAGIKTPGRPDLVVMELSEAGHVACVSTRNAFCAAPVQVCRQHLAAVQETGRGIRYLVVNTGNANAGMGETGLDGALATCRHLADHTRVDVTQVLPFSTGVIGQPLPVDKIAAALPGALRGLNEGGWLDAAVAIMTTDTRPKAACRRLTIGENTITISGIAKGAGMIRPDMATMLAYIATDAAIDQATLQQALNRAVEGSFNRITIDGDTSTNDSVVLVATGAGPEVSGAAELEAFQQALDDLSVELAQAIVKDGEGATKFVEVDVGGGASNQECLAVAFTIAESPLVKTALFAADPNWGRILAAVGRAGVGELDVNKVSIALDDVLIAQHGGMASGYRESDAQAVMDREEFAIRVDLGRGECRQQVWTTDLSHDYIRINAEYRT